MKKIILTRSNSKRNQRGQATFEFVAMLIGFVALILGIIFVTGISLSSNKMLISARNNAEKLSRYSDYEVGAKGSEYGSWTREKINLYNDNSSIEIPFSLADRVTYKGENSISNTLDTLNNPQYSVDKSLDPNNPNSVSTKYYQYKNWVGPDRFSSSLNNNFFNTTINSNARDAARLIKGEHNNDIPLVAIIDSQDQQNASFNKSSNAAQALYDAFEKLVGVRLNKKKIENSITNRVYMPIIKNNNDNVLEE